MELYLSDDLFDEMILNVSAIKNIPEDAVRRDYLIVNILKNLSESSYCEKCVFKGGTSLSKCYPNSIERFSEDIDITYLDTENSDKQIEKNIKKIEQTMIKTYNNKPINSERSQRSKSIFIWDDDETQKVKLEIGSTVRPDPYKKMEVKSYIQAYIESLDERTLEYLKNRTEGKKYEFVAIQVNVLDITRTFLDKVMAVKRHAIAGNLVNKVRHIYDVVRLYSMSEIQDFLANKEEFKQLVKLTKSTDLFYLEKRSLSLEYDPQGSYNFSGWRELFDTNAIKSMYETLHETLLYTTEKQDFVRAITTFTEISCYFDEIEE